MRCGYFLYFKITIFSVRVIRLWYSLCVNSIAPFYWAESPCFDVSLVCLALHVDSMVELCAIHANSTLVPPVVWPEDCEIANGVERANRQWVLIVVTTSGQLDKRFKVSVLSAESQAWSPDGRVLWDHILAMTSRSCHCSVHVLARNVLRRFVMLCFRPFDY